MLPPGEDDGAWSGKPQMVLMSDDPEAWRMFVESEGGQAFRVRGTEARERRREMRIAKRAAAEMEEVNPFKKTGGFVSPFFARRAQRGLADSGRRRARRRSTSFLSRNGSR